MVHVVYDINTKGGIFGGQSGSGYDGPYFKGVRFQRGYGPRQYGYGVGSLLSKAWRYLKPYAKKYVVPLVKEAAGAVSEEGREAVQNFLKDVMGGEDPKEALVTRSTEAAKKLSKRAGAKLTQMGSGKRKRKVSEPGPAPKRLRASVKNLHLVGRSVLESAAKKRNRASGLGLTL